MADLNPRTITVGPGKTYASLNAALVAQKGAYPNLTVDNGTGSAGVLIFECYAFEDTTPIPSTSVNGWTTSVDYYLKIIGAPSDKTSSNTGKWSTERYRLVLTLAASDALCLSVSQDYTVVSDLQIQHTVVSPSISQHTYRLTRTCRIERCIAKAVVSGTQGSNCWVIGFGVYAASVTCDVWNCLAYDYVNGAEVHIGFRMGNYSTSVMNSFNCTVQNTNLGFSRAASTHNVTNCGASGCSTAFGSGTTVVTSSSSTPTFVDESGDDFHLGSGDTTWKNAGTDLSATFTDDIDGQTRPTGAGTWDIGADEYAASQAPGSIVIQVRM